MKVVCSINNRGADNTLDNVLQVLFSKLDEAIEDIENGRVVSEEDLWEELDSI